MGSNRQHARGARDGVGEHGWQQRCLVASAPRCVPQVLQVVALPPRSARSPSRRRPALVGLSCGACWPCVHMFQQVVWMMLYGSSSPGAALLLHRAIAQHDDNDDRTWWISSHRLDALDSTTCVGSASFHLGIAGGSMAEVVSEGQPFGVTLVCISIAWHMAGVDNSVASVRPSTFHPGTVGGSMAPRDDK